MAKKGPMSEEERLALMSKLDKELDEFMEKLPRRKDLEENELGERWENDLEHPLLMTKVPELGEKVHPLYEGLQKLKYDPEENEPEELALSYKDDGNFNYKHKNYRMAVISYTEGLKAKCDSDELNATLLNNRAAANYFLKNYRSSLQDCEAALKLKPGYSKAAARGANCAFNIKKYDRALELCDMILDVDKDNVEIIELRKKVTEAAKVQERDKRKREVAVRKQKLEEERILGEIAKRGLKLAGVKDKLDLSLLEPQFPQLFSNRVDLSKEGTLVWPVVLVYPEYKIMDYLQQFDESTTFFEQFQEVFEHPPEWDSDRKYSVDNLNVYFENSKRKLTKVDLDWTLYKTLKMEGYVIENGTPKFIVLVRGSRAETQFLESYS